MVEDEIKAIICFELKNYLLNEIISINAYPGNGMIKYVITTKKGFFEMTYFFVDSFYRFKYENTNRALDKTIVLFSKSKKYHKELGLFLKRNKTKKFQTHVYYMAVFIRNFLKNNESLPIGELYDSSLNFDGIFI